MTKPCAPPAPPSASSTRWACRSATRSSPRSATRCASTADALAREAHEETGLGRYEDKVLKNQLVTEKTPGTEDLQPQAVTGDDGLNLTEPAPYGVIAAITPTTNPTSTIINNTIAMLAAGNAVVFNVHPNARRVSCHNVALINKAIVAAGGPRNLITCIANPTVESAQALMKHPGIRLVVVTGGGGVVQAAMSSGKRAICAGPGNPPVVVDETADIDKAGARHRLRRVLRQQHHLRRREGMPGRLQRGRASSSRR